MAIERIGLLFFLFVLPLEANVNEKQMYRLEDNVIPYHYEIELTVPNTFGTDGKFIGKTKILFSVKSETSEIEFHSDKLLYNETNIFLMQTSVVNSIYNVKHYSFNETLQKVAVKFDRALIPSINYTINVNQYEGILDLDMLGFYRAKYKDVHGNFQWIAVTQFEPTHARRAFPCFDEPKYKAKFNIIINHPTNYNALSNANIKEIRLFSDSKQTVFETTPTMSTYIVAFAVTKYVSMSATVSEIKHVVWSSVETIPFAQYALTLSPKLVAVMEKFTNIPYAISNLSTVNHISIPDFSAGAMENWGLITYRETALLWNPETSSARNKQRVATVVAHELSHMWFGNLVSPKWWSSTWLNEGFARYFEYMSLAEVEKDWDLQNQFIIEQQQRILISDALDKSKPITNYNVFTPSEVSGMFDSTTYNKGGSIIRMMSIFLGKHVFYKGLQSYLFTHKFNSSVPLDLLNTLNNYVELTDPLPESLPKIMSNWTEKPGFPVVTVYSSGYNVVLKQNQFGAPNNTNGTKWFIPISYTTSKEKNFIDVKPKIWMLPNTRETVIGDIWSNTTSWIIVNIKSSAFIRVNYHETIWDALQTALRKYDFDQIIPINRAQLVDDAMNLARINVITYKRALNILLYLNHELEYYPWYSAFNAFSYLTGRIAHNTKLYELLNNHILGLMRNMYENATYSVTSKNQVEKHKEVLALTWACKLNMNECVTKMQILFNSYKKHDAMFNPNFRDVVYCTATRYATDEENWEFLWKKLESSTSADEISILLSALGCTNDESILKRYLKESITENSVIRRQDGQTVFRSVITGNPIGVDIGLKFLIDNFKNITVRYGGMNALSSVITDLADRLTAQEQVTKLEAFIASNKDKLKDAVTAAGTAIENAKKNLQWVVKNERELLDYFQANQRGIAYLNSPSLAFISIVAAMHIFSIL